MCLRPRDSCHNTLPRTVHTVKLTCTWLCLWPKTWYGWEWLKRVGNWDGGREGVGLGWTQGGNWFIFIICWHIFPLGIFVFYLHFSERRRERERWARAVQFIAYTINPYTIYSIYIVYCKSYSCILTTLLVFRCSKNVNCHSNKANVVVKHCIEIKR